MHGDPPEKPKLPPYPLLDEMFAEIESVAVNIDQALKNTLGEDWEKVYAVDLNPGAMDFKLNKQNQSQAWSTGVLTSNENSTQRKLKERVDELEALQKHMLLRLELVEEVLNSVIDSKVALEKENENLKEELKNNRFDLDLE